MSGNQLTSLDLGTADNLADLQLKDCSLAKSVVDYILLTLDQVGQPNGTLVLTGNEAPSSAGIVHRDNLKIKGWTISITKPGQQIPVTDITITSAGGVNTISSDKGTLQLNAEIIPTISTDNTVLWSITSGANLAKVDNTSLVTALHNGIITVMATAHNNSEIYDEMVIIISNQINSDDVNFPSIGKIIVNINELKILLNEDYTSWKASLYNFQGNLVSCQFVENDLLIFNISKLVPGIYIVVLSKGDNIRVAEFIKP